MRCAVDREPSGREIELEARLRVLEVALGNALALLAESHPLQIVELKAMLSHVSSGHPEGWPAETLTELSRQTEARADILLEPASARLGLPQRTPQG
jgi:hypothetical protein